MSHQTALLHSAHSAVWLLCVLTLPRRCWNDILFSPANSYIFFLPDVILVWAGSHGGHDGLHDLLPQSLWIPQGKTHWRTDETAVKELLVIVKPLVQVINKYLYGSSMFNLGHLRKKKLKSFIFLVQDKLGAYFLSKMDSTNKKTQEVCDSHCCGEVT